MGEKKKKKTETKKDTPTVWFSLKKSLHCKSEPSDVHDPTAMKQLGPISTKKAGRSGCSRSIANLKDVIHGSKRHLDEKPASCSPRSIGSSEFLNPITHEVILSNSKCELKITGFNGGFQENPHGGGGGGGGSAFVGTLRPGTPQPTMDYFNPSSFKNSATPPRKSSHLFTERDGILNDASSQKRESHYANGAKCHKCGESFVKWEALESHHLSKHAGKLIKANNVSELKVVCVNVE